MRFSDMRGLPIDRQGKENERYKGINDNLACSQVD